MIETNEAENFLKTKKACFVRSPTDETVLVAVHLDYNEEYKTLSWWDLTKERRMEISEIKLQENNTLHVKNDEGVEYFFMPLNLGLYRNIVMSKLSNPQDFDSEAEMIAAFEKTTYP